MFLRLRATQKTRDRSQSDRGPTKRAGRCDLSASTPKAPRFSPIEANCVFRRNPIFQNALCRVSPGFAATSNPIPRPSARTREAKGRRLRRPFGPTNALENRANKANRRPPAWGVGCMPGRLRPAMVFDGRGVKVRMFVNRDSNRCYGIARGDPPRRASPISTDSLGPRKIEGLTRVARAFSTCAIRSKIRLTTVVRRGILPIDEYRFLREEKR